MKAEYAKSVRSASREPFGYSPCVVIFVYKCLLVGWGSI